MKPSLLAVFYFIFLVCADLNLKSQDTAAPLTQCPERDLADVLRAALKAPEKQKKPNAGSLLLVPIIGSNPATGFMYGVGGQFAFRRPESKRYSFFSGSIQGTTKNQLLLMLKNTVYSRRDRFFHTGDWRFLIFSQSTYGLGTTAPESSILSYQYSIGGLETTEDSLAQPMKFNFARLHQTLGFRLAEGIYLGLGYQFDSYFNIVDERLRLSVGDTLLTSNYSYSSYYGFNPDKYLSSALNVSFIIDTRDNMIEAHKGYFLSVSGRGDFKFLGSSSSSQMLSFEWRSFHGLSKKNASHVIAFWLLGNLTPAGGYAYLILPATSYDQRSRSARGYTQGRFRGNNYVYAETEYRFPLSRCGGILGGVVFVNVTSASSPVSDLKLFESFKPAAGFGLRVKLDKRSRTNLTVDYGFGVKSSGFYLAVSETF